MTDDLPTSPQQLLSKLDKMGFKTTTHEHIAVFSVEESDAVTADIPGAHTKNLFVKDKKDNYFLIVTDHHSRIALNKVHTLIGARTRVSFGKPEKLFEYLGVKPGSVNAFSPINDTGNNVCVIIDEPLLDNDFINCHPLTNTMTTTISKQDLLTFLKEVGHEPKVIKVSEEITN